MRTLVSSEHLQLRFSKRCLSPFFLLFLALLSDVSLAQLSWKSVTLGANPRHSGSGWGYSVAIDGDYMVVGSPYYDYTANGFSACTDCGGASVFKWDGGSWVYLQRLAPSGTNSHIPGDGFGYSVAISGTRIAVGAPNHGYDASGGNFLSRAGAVHTFTLSGGTWSHTQKLVGTGTNGRLAYDLFGTSVAMYGNQLVVGSPNQDYGSDGTNYVVNSGAIYVYSFSSTWNLQQKIVGAGTNGRKDDDLFGTSVAIANNLIVSGAPNQDYDANGGNLAYEAGAAYTYSYNGSSWNLQYKLVGTGTSGRSSNDKFGSSVAITTNYTLVGAPYQDYDASGGNFASDAGAAYVFSGPTLQQKLVGTGINGRNSSDRFGCSVAMYGTRAVVGAFWQDYDAAGGNYTYEAGAVYVFVYNGSTWPLTYKLTGSGTNGRVTSDYFGSAVAISSSNGNCIAVGATNQDYDASGANSITDAGAAYAFIYPDKTWTGSSSTNWSVAGNWSPSGVPGSGHMIHVPTGTVNLPVLSSNISIPTGRIILDTLLSLNGYELSSRLTFRGNGRIKGSPNSWLYLYSPTKTLKMSQQDSGMYLNYLTLYTSSIILEDTLKLRGSLFPNGNNLTSDGYLVLAALSPTSYGMLGSDVTSSTLSGSFRIEKVLSNTSAGWRQFSLPLNANLSDLKGMDLLGSAHANSSQRNVYYWNASDAGSGVAGGWTSATVASDNQSKRYSVYSNNNHEGFHDLSGKIYLDGTLRSGNVNFALYNTSDPNGGSNPDKTGWNLVGNPYASNLLVSSLWSATGFPTYKAIHIYDMSSGSPQYTVICSTGVSINQYNNNQTTNNSARIAPFQAFWVKTSSNTTLTLTSSMQSTSTISLGTFMKNELPILRVRLQNDKGQSDETALYFHPEGRETLNEATDAYKMFSLEAGVPGLFWKTENTLLSIKALDPQKDRHLIALGWDYSSTDSISLSFDDSEFQSGWNITLINTFSGNRISVTPHQTIRLYGKKNHTQWQLELSRQVTGLTNSPIEEKLLVNNAGDEVLISGSSLEGRSWTVFSINGQELASGTFGDPVSGWYRIALNSFPTGAYLLGVENIPGRHIIIKQ